MWCCRACTHSCRWFFRSPLGRGLFRSSSYSRNSQGAGRARGTTSFGAAACHAHTLEGGCRLGGRQCCSCHRPREPPNRPFVPQGTAQPQPPGGGAVTRVGVGLFRSSPRLVLIRIKSYPLFSSSIGQRSWRLSPSSQFSQSRLQRRLHDCRQRTLRALEAAATTRPPTGGRAATARVPPGGGGAGMRRNSAHMPPLPPLAQPDECRGMQRRGRWYGGGIRPVHCMRCVCRACLRANCERSRPPLSRGRPPQAI